MLQNQGPGALIFNCEYLTRVGRYWSARVTRGHLYVTELRLYKFDGYGGRELLETRYDTWDVT